MFLKLILILFLFCNSSFARIIEEIIEVPVSVSNSNFTNNPKFEQKITVTIWRDDAIKKAPYLLFSHGRAGTDQERGKFGRSSEKRNSEYFVNGERLEELRNSSTDTKKDIRILKQKLFENDNEQIKDYLKINIIKEEEELNHLTQKEKELTKNVAKENTRV